MDTSLLTWIASASRTQVSLYISSSDDALNRLEILSTIVSMLKINSGKAVFRICTTSST